MRASKKSVKGFNYEPIFLGRPRRRFTGDVGGGGVKVTEVSSSTISIKFELYGGRPLPLLAGLPLPLLAVGVGIS